jgi:amidase
MGDLVFSTAGELATSIQLRQVSATEVLEAYLAQIAQQNPSVIAIITVDEEGARARAREADAALARGNVWGPLHGVPVTFKDSIDTAGMRTTVGHPPLADNVPCVDAPVVAQLRAAGAIVLGKSNLPELASDGQTDNPIFGRTNNPWDVTRTPGGSTGGGAAAVAAGLTALEIGSDGAGSLRIPPHYCGVFALKPNEHRVPDTGHYEFGPGVPPKLRHMHAIGPIARNVGDLVQVLRLIAGPDGYQWELPPVPVEPARVRPVAQLRLAWTDDFGGVPVTVDTEAALGELAAELDSLGCRVERRGPEGFDVLTAWETCGELAQAETSSIMPPEAVEQAASMFTEDSEDPLIRGLARGLNATMRHYSAALARRDALISALEQFLGTWDAWLCPVAVGPAFHHCPSGSSIAVDDREVPYWTALTAYTSPFSLTGHPAVVLPLARSAEGLPIGLQVIGRRWGEMPLLAIAAQLADVIGPFRRPPGF